MSKQIFFNKEVHDRIRRGAKVVSDAVRLTMGPRGRNVAIDKGYGSPTITNDGVSIAKEITLEDKIENMGAEIIKEIAMKTNDEAGDGTTTATVLACEMIEKGFAQVDLGVNAIGIRLGMEEAKNRIIEELKKISHPIKDKKNIIQVATISAESEEIGKIIADTIDKVGIDAVVTVEESEGVGIVSEVVDGMQLDKGYISPYMITNRERMESEMKNAYILITDRKISTMVEIVPILEKLIQSGKKELVIIAEDIDGEALTNIVLNRLRGVFNILGIKAPGYGDKKKELLQDIAILTGGKVIDSNLQEKLEDTELTDLGVANRIISNKDKTTIVGGKSKGQALNNRIKELKNELANTKATYEKDKIAERIAKLSGGVAVLKVGAGSESEMKYLKLKIEDAVNATKAAIDEGIVVGGGVALVRVANNIRKQTIKSTHKLFEKEFNIGVDIVLQACEAPILQIARNAGRTEDAMIIANDIKHLSGFAGYDAGKDEIVKDMIVAGIIDPVKVTRSAISNAVSATAILLTTNSAIIDSPKKEESKHTEMPGGMGMGY
ncbi:MAG: chaperonin GroEL [Candidatus Pacebacteria bacterium]|nr:chaperonin GroEL [Candidatus Paceibacterota bacterium]